MNLNKQYSKNHLFPSCKTCSIVKRHKFNLQINLQFNTQFHLKMFDVHSIHFYTQFGIQDRTRSMIPSLFRICRQQFSIFCVSWSQCQKMFYNSEINAFWNTAY